MSVNAIVNQPATGTFVSAYSPILFDAEVTGEVLPQVVYCDIYINGLYYKTISATQYEYIEDSFAVYRFDIQDACQEVIQKYIAQNGGQDIIDAITTIIIVVCKFRTGDLDENGFTVSDSLEPIQSTGEDLPVSGGGFESNEFCVINLSLQHFDNQDIISHLSEFKKGDWDENTFPLTHRVETFLCKNDDDFYYLITNKVPDCITINYYKKGDSNLYTLSSCEAPPPSCNLHIEELTVEYDEGFIIRFRTYDGSTAVLPSTTEMEYRDVPSGSFQDALGSVSADGFYTVLTLIDPSDENGVYEFRITPHCENGLAGTPSLVSYGSEPPPCFAPNITGGLSMPDATSGQLYDYEVGVSGTPPLSLSIIEKPSWMSISLDPDLVGYKLSFTGTPPDSDIGNSVDIQIEVTNTCGTTGVISDSITILAGNALNWNYINNAGGAGRFRILLNGDEVVSVTESDSGQILYTNGDTVSLFTQTTIEGLATVYVNGPDVTNLETQPHIATYFFTATSGLYFIEGDSEI